MTDGHPAPRLRGVGVRGLYNTLSSDDFTEKVRSTRGFRLAELLDERPRISSVGGYLVFGLNLAAWCWSWLRARLAKWRLDGEQPCHLAACQVRQRSSGSDAARSAPPGILSSDTRQDAPCPVSASPFLVSSSGTTASMVHHNSLALESLYTQS